MKRKWIDKKVLILGLSKSGVAAAKYLSEKGADCYITEYKPLEDKDRDLVAANFQISQQLQNQYLISQLKTTTTGA